MDYELITAFIFGLLMLGVALGVIVARKPFASALFLLATLLLMAINFALLSADFLAVLQIMIYVGAIAVLIIFMVILLGAGNKPNEIASSGCACFLNISSWLDGFFDSSSKLEFISEWFQRLVAQGLISQLLTLAFKFFLVLLFSIGLSALLYFSTDWEITLPAVERTGSIHELGRVLFVKYTWVVEFIAILILVAIVGAVMLAHEEKQPLLPGRGLKAKQK
ncbi:MAG: NADH-quinone oxidoreductase subunit J [Deltaproteobacteria bacterium]|jgi:NADH-quinone oxidoreductase subunit J|nr:NADH-quinone oxidoreductase subunit J [Deltaproteobacteria bacterium]